MSARTIRQLLVILAVLALPVVTSAQEATIGGTVRDTTGGVLPGVAVRAIHEATGNMFETVTDERGGFRVAVRTGTYRMIVELSGFSTRAIRRNDAHALSISAARSAVSPSTFTRFRRPRWPATIVSCLFGTSSAFASS